MAKAQIRTVEDHGVTYEMLAFWCPGCERYRDGDPEPAGGLHMLPVNTTAKSPAWTWNGSLAAPTLAPSILSRVNLPSGVEVCHSFLVDGVFQFLGDCTHQYANQNVPMPEMPEWATQ